MKLKFILFAVICGVAFGNSNAQEMTVRSADDDPNEVLRKYDSENIAPDYVAYRSFLRLLAATDDEEKTIHFLGHKLNIAHSEAGDKYVREVYLDLIERAELLATDISYASYQALCGNDRHSREKDEVYRLMDDLVETRERIAEEHYLRMVTEVDIDTSVALDNLIQNTKENFTSVSLSHKSTFEPNGETDRVFAHVEGMCEKKAIEFGD